MSESKNNLGIMRVLEVSAIVLSVLTGVMNTGTILFKGGQLFQVIAHHEARLTNIEGKGTSIASAHIQVDDAREAAMRERITALENIYKLALDMRSDISRLTAEVSDLKTTLSRQIK